MDINTEEMKKTLLEKTEVIRKVLDSKPAVKGLLGKKLLVALVGVVLVAGIAVGCKGTKKVPDYLEVEDRKDGTWVIGYDASIIPESVKIPDGIVGISGITFENCELLESVKIAGSVKTIGGRVFSGCTSLESVTLAKGLETIGSGAFLNCTSLKEVRYENTIERFKAIATLDDEYWDPPFASFGRYSSFEKGVVIHCTDGDYVFDLDW